MLKYSIHMCISLFIFSCSQTKENRVDVTFEHTKDSIFVDYKNTCYCPVFSKVTNLETDNITFTQANPEAKTRLLQFSNEKEDSISILKNYKFRHLYGYYSESKQGYDTTHNYVLPYLKGKQFKVIQGYNGNFTHNNSFSRYTIDFNMKIGDTVCASREGIVIKVVRHHDKQGTTKKFRPFANYIVVYHKDNTIAQYVHLKQNSNFVNVGDSVKVNQPIGLSGFTGLTTTPHLHFGVFKPTKNGLNSIPIYLDSLKGNVYKKHKIFKK